MRRTLTLALAAVAGVALLSAAPARADLVLAAGPDQGSFTNNFGFGADGTGSSFNPNADYWTGPTKSTETWGSHLGNAPVAILFVFGPNGEVSTYTDSTVGAYDDVEDTQIGVLNNSGATLTSFKLTSSKGEPFNFDGDGISDGTNADVESTAHGAGAPTNGKDDSDGHYGGPLAYFTLTAPGSTGDFTSSTGSSAYVNFRLGGLASGSSTYFSLEGLPSDLSDLGSDSGNFSTPEPSSIVTAASSVLLLLGYGWRRRRAGLAK